MRPSFSAILPLLVQTAILGLMGSNSTLLRHLSQADVN